MPKYPMIKTKVSYIMSMPDFTSQFFVYYTKLVHTKSHYILKSFTSLVRFSKIGSRLQSNVFFVARQKIP